MPAGNVSLLPPAQDLLYAHHGSGKTGSRIALAEDHAGSCGVGTAVGGTPTRKFNNPWPSYQMASLSDAMLSYQRGAAIAPPQLPESIPSRTPSRAQTRTNTINSKASSLRNETRNGNGSVLSGNVTAEPQPLVDISSQENGENVTSQFTPSVSSNDSGSTAAPKESLVTPQPRSTSNTPRYTSPRSPFWLKPDDPDDAADEDDEESIEGLDDESWSFQHPPGEPVRGYIRPSFSRIMTQDDQDDWREPPILVERPCWSRGGDTPLVTWLGHAGALVQIPWTNQKDGARAAGSGAPYCGIIFDPIFSYRCSPSQLVGPARHLDPPCFVSELPTIHACCISHDHYDHLDYQTILDLWAMNMATIHFFVPLGLAQWFHGCGIPEQRVTELDWWHEAILSFPLNDSEGGTSAAAYPPLSPSKAARVDPSAALTLKFAFTPAQHRSGRGLFDHMTSLWGSWCVGVVGPGREVAAVRPGMAGWDDFKVYFGGDTGYRYATAHESGDESAVCPAFGEIGLRYGPFSLSMLPLSTGSSLPFLRSLLMLSLDQYTLTSSQHCSPADSLDIHLLLKAKRSLGIHWGTFCDAAEARATRVEFGRARRDRNISNDWDHAGERGAFVIADIGLVMEIE